MPRLRLGLLFFLLAAPQLAVAAGMPDDGVLEFAILRNGTEIGRHVIRFEERGEPTVVQITAEIDYRIEFIPFYTFRHTARET